MTTIIGLIIALSINHIMLFDFNAQSNLNKWLIVNDDVMGGKSKATFTMTKNETALFEGRISLENNGGFSSVRYRAGYTNIEGLNTMVLRVKGDGKNYQVRIREDNDDYFSYIAYFESSGEWETIEIPLKKMYPSYRGRKLDRQNFDGNSIVEFALLIGNKKAESFAIEIDSIAFK